MTIEGFEFRFLEGSNGKPPSELADAMKVH
jgi:hypothetical protein